MKATAEETREMSGPSDASDAPQYPYGLSIDLDDGSLEKLGITALPKVGTEMMVTARCVVKSISSYDTQGGEAESRVCLQITDMDIGQTENAQNDNRATMLYGDQGASS
jgi:hypothetical protein